MDSLRLQERANLNSQARPVEGIQITEFTLDDWIDHMMVLGSIGQNALPESYKTLFFMEFAN